MEVGDYVYWTHVSRGRGTLSLALREGMIVSITGNLAVIRKCSGRTEEVTLERLRSSARESQISEFVEALFGRA